MTIIVEAWVPGQGVKVDYASIIEILIQQLDGQRRHSGISLCRFTNHTIDNEIKQSTSLKWFAEFLKFAPEVMVPFTPRLIPSILPNLAHHVPMIQTAAIHTNKLLLSVIQTLPSPAEKSPPTVPVSPSHTGSTVPSRASTLAKDSAAKDDSQEVDTPSQIPVLQRPRTIVEATPRVAPASDMPPPPLPPAGPSRPLSPMSLAGISHSIPVLSEEGDLLDYQATVNQLTIQFLSEYEETRVEALKWLIMLHQKAPKKVHQSCRAFVDWISSNSQILSVDDGTFPALLKTLSDSSEEVRNNSAYSSCPRLRRCTLGDQARPTASRPDMLQLGRKLFQSVYDESARVIQH